jgi:hypothetical protein
MTAALQFRLSMVKVGAHVSPRAPHPHSHRRPPGSGGAPGVQGHGQVGRRGGRVARGGRQRRSPRRPHVADRRRRQRLPVRKRWARAARRARAQRAHQRRQRGRLRLRSTVAPPRTLSSRGRIIRAQKGQEVSDSLPAPASAAHPADMLALHARGSARPASSYSAGLQSPEGSGAGCAPPRA